MTSELPTRSTRPELVDRVSSVNSIRSVNSGFSSTYLPRPGSTPDVCLPLETIIDFGVLDEYVRNSSPRPYQGPENFSENFSETYESDVSELPQRYAFFCDGQTIRSPNLQNLVQADQSMNELFNNGLENKFATWWLDCIPTELEMRTIARAFSLHPLTTEDILTQEPREKVELFGHYYLVSFHAFDIETLQKASYYIVVFKDGVLSFHFTQSSHAATVRKRIRQQRAEYSSDWICYALIDDITDEFVPVIRRLEHSAEAIDDLITAGDSDFSSVLNNIGTCRRVVMALMRLLSPKADVLKSYSKRCEEKGYPIPTMYLIDIQDHLITMFQSLISYEKILSRCHSNYLAQLQVKSVQSGNQMTKLFSKLTLIGTAILPLHIISGLFGMNVRVPGEDGDSLAWFFGILGVMLAIISISLYFLKRWLDSVTRRRPNTWEV